MIIYDMFISLISMNHVQYVIRLCTAMMLGMLIGYDRNKKGSPAGIKTHSLVCIGSALVMITSEFSYTIHQSGDITRMAAQVVSGIGFLGAGTIIVTGKHRVKGLTTAAGIWFCACVGIAIGAGFFFEGIMASILEIYILRKFDYYGNERHMDLLVEYDASFSLITCIKTLKQMDCTFRSIENANDYEIKNHHFSIITIETKNNQLTEDLLMKIKDIKGILDVVEL